MKTYEPRGLADTVEDAKERLLADIERGATIKTLKHASAFFAFITKDTELEDKAAVYLNAVKQIESEDDRNIY